MTKRLTTTLLTGALTATLVGAPLTACSSSSGDGADVPGINDALARVTVVATTPDDITTVDTASGTTPADTTPPTTGATTTAAPPAPPPTAAPTIATDPPTEVEYLRQGDESPRIATMQRELIALDLLPPGSDSGVFDSATNSALRSFQSQWGLGVDGVFGPATDRALTAAAQSVAAS